MIRIDLVPYNFSYGSRLSKTFLLCLIYQALGRGRRKRKARLYMHMQWLCRHGAAPSSVLTYKFTSSGHTLLLFHSFKNSFSLLGQGFLVIEINFLVSLCLGDVGAFLYTRPILPLRGSLPRLPTIMADPLQVPALQTPAGVISQFPTTYSSEQAWFYVAATLSAVVPGILLLLRLYTKIRIVRNVDLIDCSTRSFESLLKENTLWQMFVDLAILSFVSLPWENQKAKGFIRVSWHMCKNHSFFSLC